VSLALAVAIRVHDVAVFCAQGERTVREKAKEASLARRQWCGFRSARLFEQTTQMSRSIENSSFASGTAPPSISIAGTMISSKAKRN
jgi:hypothetical protein